MKERVAYICSFLPRCRVFADIGCDHGYMTKYMLENQLCERAYISDISAASLRKAERLLANEIAAGRCFPVVGDGLEGLPEPFDLVLIAGMGGEEIVSILEKFPLPQRFVLQPMKNSEKVRRFLVARGARLECDVTFSEERGQRRYYDLISGSAAGGDAYTEREFRYGRDNLNGNSPLPFLNKMQEERDKLRNRLAADGMNAKSRAALTEQFREREEIIDEIQRTL